MSDEIRDRTSPTWRGIEVTRTGDGLFEATNQRGGTLPVGAGDDRDFTPVELFLVSLAACGASNVEAITSRRATPTTFTVTGEGHKVRDDGGNHLVDLRVTFDITFPDGPDGDRAREVLPRSVQQTHDRICTVSRTVDLGEPVEYAVVEPPH